MLRELFVHVCIVITFLFIGGSFFRFTHKLSSLRQKILFGTYTGVLGSLLMLFTINLTPEIIMDYRHIAILLAALYGGAISTVVSVTIICLSRYFMIGGPESSIIISSIVMVCIGVFSVLIAKSSLSEIKKWIYMYLFSLVILTAGFEYLLGITKEFYFLMLKYWSISLGAGVLLFYCTNYIIYSNRSFYDMKLQSTTDFLTGLNNVRQFHSSFSRSIEKANKHDEKLSFLMIDIDHFKVINDTYGHQAGDAVLKQVGALLSTCARSFDIPSRMGGEEFSLLLLNCTNEQALEISERIRTTIEKYDFILPDAKKIKLTVSIGVSTYLETTLYPDRLLKQADIALYNAKHAGRNKVHSILTS